MTQTSDGGSGPRDGPQHDEGSEHYLLLLCVAGTGPNSVRAIANTRRMCQRYLANRYTLTIIDLYQQPELAKNEQIIAAPTLVRKQPLPVKRLVGDMVDAARILLSVHLPPASHTKDFAREQA